jgi:AraC-like DNA-binding protein
VEPSVWPGLSSLYFYLQSREYSPECERIDMGGRFHPESNYLLRFDLKTKGVWIKERPRMESMSEYTNRAGDLIDGTPGSLVIDSTRARVKVRFRLLENASRGLWSISSLANPDQIRQCNRVIIVEEPPSGISFKNMSILIILCLIFILVITYRYLLKRSKQIARGYARELARINEFLINNLSKNLSNEEIATKVGMSPSSLRRVYKKASGTTIKAFILEERLRAARDLLAKTDKSISSISYDLGFNEPSYFSRLFKDRFGIPPQDYRNKKLEL